MASNDPNEEKKQNQFRTKHSKLKQQRRERKKNKNKNKNSGSSQSQSQSQSTTAPMSVSPDTHEQQRQQSQQQRLRELGIDNISDMNSVVSDLDTIVDENENKNNSQQRPPIRRVVFGPPIPTIGERLEYIETLEELLELSYTKEQWISYYRGQSQVSYYIPVENNDNDFIEIRDSLEKENEKEFFSFKDYVSRDKTENAERSKDEYTMDCQITKSTNQALHTYQYSLRKKITKKMANNPSKITKKEQKGINTEYGKIKMRMTRLKAKYDTEEKLTQLKRESFFHKWYALSLDYDTRMEIKVCIMFDSEKCLNKPKFVATNVTTILYIILLTIMTQLHFLFVLLLFFFFFSVNVNEYVII